MMGLLGVIAITRANHVVDDNRLIIDAQIALHRVDKVLNNGRYESMDFHCHRIRLLLKRVACCSPERLLSWQPVASSVLNMAVLS
jgi:hypothetical protein